MVMRRYISIFVVTLVAIFATTSCQLEGGTTADTQRANRMLWNRVYDGLNEHTQHITTIAYLNDAMLDIKWDTDNKPIGIEEKESGDYIIYYGEDKYYYPMAYRIVTGGKRLDEGGEWVVYVKYGTYMEFAKVGTAQGRVGEATKFHLKTDNGASMRYNYIYTQQADVEYSYNSTEEALHFVLSSVEGVSTDTSSIGSEADFIIEYNSVEPLVFIDETLYSGEVDILYRDFVENATRSLTVQIANKIITFAPKN